MELASYGELAVLLVNTEPSGPTGRVALARRDRLSDLEDLQAFIGEHPVWERRGTVEDLRALRELRSRLREVFDLAVAGTPAAAVAALNALLAQTEIRPQITDHDGAEWHLHLSEGAESVATAYAAGAVMGLAVQLTGIGLDRLGVCQADACRRVFVDTSTNRSRRYCSDRCATRSNVAAYRARRRAVG